MCAIFVFYVHPERWIDWLTNSFCLHNGKSINLFPVRATKRPQRSKNKFISKISIA